MSKVQRYSPVLLAFLVLTFSAGGETLGLPLENAPRTENASWIQVTPLAQWSLRHSQEAVVFDNRIWMVGGFDALGQLWQHDVWYSADGKDWHEATVDAGWRDDVRVVVFRNKLWALGGTSGVWSSDDGVTWSHVTPNAPWPARSSHTAAAYAGKLWVLWGDSGVYARDVWNSEDGVNWAEAAHDALGSGDYVTDPHAFVFDNHLCVFGGVPHTPGEYDIWPVEANEVWCTTDGVNWSGPQSGPPYSSRFGETVVVAGGRLWVLGGEFVWGDPRHPSSFILMNNVYSSSDVVNWKQVLSAEWPPRSRFGAVAFHDNIWVLGGFALYDDEPYYGMSDVWRLPLAPDISLAIETGHAPWYQIGEPLNLKVVGTGLSGEETYDWQKDGSPLTDQTNSAYHVDALALSDAGSYACLVNDPANTGTLTAGPVSIMVLPPGYRLPLVSVIGVLLIIISAAIGVRAINFRRT